jgi:nitrogen fixation protein NifX
MARSLRLIRPGETTNEDENQERAGAMKIAFATQDLKRVDAHFGWAKNMAVYELTPEDSRLVEVFRFEGELKEDGNEDKIAPKVEAIRDCAIVYVAAIGGSAAGRVVQAGIHPIKVAQPEEISGLLAKLQTVLRGNPPPWLRKALLKGKERDFDFEDEDEATHA